MTLMGVVVSTLGLEVNTSSKEQAEWTLLGAYMAHMMSSSSFSTLLLGPPPHHTQLRPSSLPSPFPAIPCSLPSPLLAQAELLLPWSAWDTCDPWLHPALG